jgi:uncharacterized protein
MIIDCHVHLLTANGYCERLMTEVKKCGIDKICLLAGQNNLKIWGSRMASNEQLIEAYRMYPENIIPFGFVELGVDPLSLIDNLYAAGCKGIKVTRPRMNYNADELLPYYARACAYKMPILFHTGTVLRTEEDQYYDVDSSRMRPIYLDRIARRFPALRLIGAHLGNPWYEEAAMTLFWNENLCFDLSGTTLKRKKAAWFNEVLWWTPAENVLLSNSSSALYKSAQHHPFYRICYGSDSPIEELAQSLKEYQKIMDELEVAPYIRERVLGGNVSEMLHLCDPAEEKAK